MRELNPTELKRLHRQWRQRTPGRLALILDGVQGPFNIGSMIRTAAAYRAETLWYSPTSTDPNNPKVAKTALGTDRFLTITRAESTVAAIAAARADGFQVVGIELAQGAVPLHTLDLSGAVCLVLGNEDHGMGAAGLAACDHLGFLPMLGKVGSLNVATAGSMAMYEWARQQWCPPSQPEGPSAP